MNTDAKITLSRIDSLDSLRGDADALTALLDDKGVRGQISHVGWPGLFPYRPMASFSAAYSASALYIDFLVRCNYLRAENYLPQSPVSEDSCVEFFVEPRPGGEYWNFEFNCIMTMQPWVSRLSIRRKMRQRPRSPRRLCLSPTRQTAR